MRITYLNTSHVKVKQYMDNQEFRKERFKYISC